MTAKRRTLQGLIRRRQTSAFVGRKDHLSLFEESLELPVDDPRRRFLFSIHGDAGIGKTYLVRQLMRLAEERSWRTAYTDEALYDVVSTMETIALRLEQQGARFKGFRDKLHHYRERQQEIDSDPGAPDELTSIITRSALRVGLRAASDVPVVGALTDEIDADAMARQVDRLRTFLSKRFRNNDDVQLLINPIGCLTPLFIDDLYEAAETSPIALFFDTYERTSSFLEAWLLEILAERHGGLPERLMICISGQLPLDVNRWGEYLGIRADIKLEVFTEAEARSLLAERGVIDEDVTNVILKLTGRLPLLVAMLAEVRPDSAELVADPSGNAVERFLKWESDETRRMAALHGALPRRLDQDRFAVASQSSSPQEDFAWLCRLPFVAEHPDGFGYHDFVRSAMLRVLQRTAPGEWQKRHDALARHYVDQRERLNLDGRAAWTDFTWQAFVIEEQYHRLVAHATSSLTLARAALVTTIAWRPDMLQRWAQATKQVADETTAPAIDHLATLVDQWSNGSQAKIRLLSHLVQDHELSDRQRGTALSELGDVYLQDGEHNRALIEHNRAVELNSQDPWIALARGRLHQSRNDYHAALDDFSRALSIEPGYRWAIAEIGMTHHFMGDLKTATEELTRAIEIGPEDDWLLASRGNSFFLMGRYEDAVSDLSRAIELDPGYSYAIVIRGRSYGAMGRHEESLTDLNHALELSPQSSWILAQRGEAHRTAGRLDDAIVEFNRAIEVLPEYAYAIASRGQTYYSMGQHEGALVDFNHALLLDPESTWILTERGEAYRKLGELDKAIKDLDKAIKGDPNDPYSFVSRGKAHRAKGQGEQAMDDFNRAVALDPESTWILAERGESHRQSNHFSDALTDFNQAIKIEPKYTYAIASRGQIYQATGQLERALADFSHAIEIDPELAWALVERGRAHRQAGRLDHAIADLTRAIKIDPSNSLATVALARTYAQLGRFDDALKEIDRAIKAESDQAWILCVRGELLRAANRLDDAISCIRQSIEIHPQGWSHYQLSICMFLRGDREEARQTCRTAIDLEREKIVADPSANFRRFNVAVYSLLHGDQVGCLEAVQAALAEEAIYEDIEAALDDFSDLHNAVGFDVAQILQVLREAASDAGGLNEVET